MPCDNMRGWDPGDSAWRDGLETKKKVEEMRKELDKVTSMLCYIMRNMKEYPSSFPPDILQWYNQHREWDKSQGRP